MLKNGNDYQRTAANAGGGGGTDAKCCYMREIKMARLALCVAHII
jgi:hypothetical protein